jgi:uncharacterized protein
VIAALIETVTGAATGAAGQPVAVMAYLAGVALVAGLARGFSGFGAALIFVPLASAAVGPMMAAPLLLVVDAVGALPMLPNGWRRADRGAVLVMNLGSLAVMPLGVMALTRLDPVTVRWGISALILVLVALLASGWTYAGRPHRAVTVLVGGVSGFLSGLAQIGGPPVVAYWLGRAAASAQEVRANIVLFFAFSTVSGAVVFGFSGLLSVPVGVLALTTGPAYMAGTMLGMRMFGLASQRTFRRICYALITLAAIIGLPVFR